MILPLEINLKSAKIHQFNIENNTKLSLNSQLLARDKRHKNTEILVITVFLLVLFDSNNKRKSYQRELTNIPIFINKSNVSQATPIQEFTWATHAAPPVAATYRTSIRSSSLRSS